MLCALQALDYSLLLIVKPPMTDPWKTIFRIALFVVFTVAMLAGLYISMFSILIPIADGVRNWNNFFDDFIHDNLEELGPVLAVFFTALFFVVFRKRKDLLQFTGTWTGIFILSLAIGFGYAHLFGNSELWYLKYSIGTVTGAIVLLIYRKNTGTHTMILGAIVSFFAIYLCENMEYLIVFDPPDNPSLMYTRSFLNVGAWFLFLLLVIVPAGLLSGGVGMKKVKAISTFDPSKE